MVSEQLSFAFARPVWLLALLPAVALCWLLYQRSQRRSGWEALLPRPMHAALLQRVASDRPRMGYVLLAGAWFISIIALAGPSWSVPLTTAATNQSAIVLVLEVTPAMLAEDVTPNRLQRARHKIHDVIRLAPDHRLALVAFAGSAHRVTPLSHDRQTLTNLLGALEPDIMPAEGNDLDAALTLAREMIADLPSAGAQILLLTAGSDPAALEALKRHAAELGPQLAILGVGTPTGAPVPNADGGFRRDEAGRILVPRLDSQALGAIARQRGAAYRSVSTTDSDLQQLLLPRQAVRGETSEQHMIWRDQGHWLLLLLLPLAAIGARRGWLGVMLLLGLLPLPAEAAWEDWWQRPDQQAAELLEQRRPAEAALRFEDPRWKAWSLYQAERYEAAAEAYADVVAGEPEQPDNHFHYGTALAMAGDYEAALEAFEQALTRDPDHEAARHNRSKVEALLEALREQAKLDGKQPAGNDAADQNGPSEKTEGAETGSDGQPASETATEQQAEPQRAAESGAADLATSSTSREPIAGSPLGAGAADGAALSPDAATEARQAEQAQSLRQWLEDIPDNPAELLRRKFLYQHMQRQQGSPP